jgi:hypothetical protein
MAWSGETSLISKDHEVEKKHLLTKLVTQLQNFAPLLFL